MNEEIVAALAKAKWNESVHVKINGEDENNVNASQDLLLVPKLDRDNGGVKWEDVSSTENAME